ncbi:TPA: VWA domain-containing protein [Clostridioides difficile]|uniref:VWA domain-containing protein n=1 Tax=Clostridioides difficile TaxID=1496 RepID=UPI000BB19D61|nr:VWA domain-containing protein [Clostridioides difficile]EGT3641080.1 VWA domain-containing protein [Clostridioides difficile]MBH7166051.1 VWA domain-containing protein [Clostridioides difficile]MBH7845765.1 VWA domain-containing protein [Clostridioides difficile]MBY1346633.1 VWA domain-containing protein [Clostridioides difficile]MBY1661378.1 VWA domain-containing protein [Clostridioides difficile]
MKNIFNFGRKKNTGDESKENINNEKNSIELKKEKVNLRKDTVSKICLTKSNFNDIKNMKFDVVLVLDCSLSTSDLFENGTIQDIFERLLPISLSFDNDGMLDVWLFNDEAYQLTSIDMNNLFNYVKDEKLFKKYVHGGTKYSPVIKEVIKEKTELNEAKDPVYVIFITDGDNSDKKEAELVIREASNKPIFFQFIGIGKQKFKFLEQLDVMEGRVVDNANLFALNDINNISDEELYERVMKELPEWVREAKKKGIF